MALRACSAASMRCHRHRTPRSGVRSLNSASQVATSRTWCSTTEQGQRSTGCCLRYADGMRLKRVASGRRNASSSADRRDAARRRPPRQSPPNLRCHSWLSDSMPSCLRSWARQHPTFVESSITLAQGSGSFSSTNSMQSAAHETMRPNMVKSSAWSTLSCRFSTDSGLAHSSSLRPTSSRPLIRRSGADSTTCCGSTSPPQDR